MNLLTPPIFQTMRQAINKMMHTTLLSGVAAMIFASYGSAMAADMIPHQNNVTLVRHVADSSSIVIGARSFIDRVAGRGIGFLSDPKMTRDQQRAAFRGLLRDSFDLPTIGRFALGPYWRVATAQQRTDYQRLFEAMVIEVYAQRFSTYNGQQLKIDDAKQVNDTDAIVTSYILPKDGGERIKLEWRVRYNDGSYRIVDVIVEGVSMSVTQRSDFSSVIQRGGGDMSVLLDYLRNPTKKG
jgi:phospholipid transport system substrate-binding protein